MHVLVLGAYGLIGAPVARRLVADGHEVTGLARSAVLGRRLVPEIGWIGADLAFLGAPAAWRDHLRGVEAVVNASGALQDGARDDLTAVQSAAIQALIETCRDAGVRCFVQISAPGAAVDASTAFLRTKGNADTALRASGLDWLILKPGLVIGPNAYGGTALIRMLASFPCFQPVMLADAAIQTVAVADVAAAVSDGIAGRVPSRRDYDLMEPSSRPLADIIGAFRQWLGFPPARRIVQVPDAMGYLLAKAGDLAAWAGWRSPLRTTALRVLETGVTGSPTAWSAAAGWACRPLDQTLADMPATAQDRVFARGKLTFPALLALLSLFWIASGAIGLWRYQVASRVLDGVFPDGIARGLVAAGSLADIGLGAALLWRPWTRGAAGAAIMVCVAYLGLGSVLTPSLWADPLGPLVKIGPVIGLCLAVAALAEER